MDKCWKSPKPGLSDWTFLAPNQGSSLWISRECSWLARERRVRWNFAPVFLIRAVEVKSHISDHVMAPPGQSNIKDLSWKIRVRNACPRKPNTVTWSFHHFGSDAKSELWPKCADSPEYSGCLKAVFGALHSPVWRITMFDLSRQAGALPQAVINN